MIVFLLILVLAFQLNRQIAEQQQASISHIAHATVRHVAQLQREHLRLYALLVHGNEPLQPEQFVLQRDLVWSRLRVLENPRHFKNLDPEVQHLIHAYRIEWQGVQLELDHWQQGVIDPHFQSALLTRMESMEQILNSTVSSSQHHFEDQITVWEKSSERLNNLLTGGMLLFIFLMLLMIYMIYQFFRIQWRNEQRVRASEQRLRVILETIPDAVFRITRDGAYVDFKPAKTFPLFVPPEFFTGKKVADIVPPDIAQVTAEATSLALKSGEEQIFEYQLTDPATGRVSSFEARLIPTNQDEIQAIIRDITEDKQHEEAAVQAQKLESLGVLAGGIAHDFNNLLTGMLAQSSLAKLKLAKGLPAVDHIDKAVISAERAADLTRQLLAYAGKGNFQIVDLDLNQLIHDTTGLFKTALSGQAQFRIELDDQLPLIKADRGQIQQVVMNLFINAVDALEGKAGTIQITTGTLHLTKEQLSNFTGSLLEARHYVVLQITDDGSGIEPAMISRIFDPFFSTKPKGHGLGLSATMGIIRALHGDLQVQSQVGQGSTFTILLPALEATKREQPSYEPALMPFNGHKQTILIIDDEASVRDAAADILADHGYRVTKANDGAEGIDLFKRQRESIGVVLLDIKMPGMNGRQTYQVLQQIEPNVKVIFMSGYSETEVNDQLEQGEVLPFLPKPYSAHQLIAQVQRQTCEASGYNN